MRRLIFVLLVGYSAIASAQESIDTTILSEIRDQAFHHSQVMDIAFHLTDASGPRLSNSPGLKRAQQWSIEAMKEWGMVHTQLEPWGTFGRGWEVLKAYLALKEPYYQAMAAYPKAWTNGSGGAFTTQVVLYKPKDSVEQAALRGTLKGKLLLLPEYRNPERPPDVVTQRYADSDLLKMANPPIGQPQIPRPAPRPIKRNIPPVPRPRRPRMEGLENFCKQEGVVGVLVSGWNNRNGTVFVQAGGPRELTSPMNQMELELGFEDHQRLQRMLEDGMPVTLEGEVACRALEIDSVGYNVIGEIPGTDKRLKNQLVMLGGHLDSWQGATGATDNGAGAAVMLEVVRILETIHIHPRRTIRIVLWSGEEQGLLGSRGYVQEHKADLDKISAYYNLDNGTGKIRGIYLQEDSAAGPIFHQWLSSFSDLGATTITPENTGGTDHLSFTDVGVPGFQFIQDPIDYDDRTHHSNMDNYDHLLSKDLEQAACIIAAFVYQTAMRDALIPRKL